MSGSGDGGNIYNEPMFFGDFNGQMAMGNRKSVQHQTISVNAAADIATVVDQVLKQLDALGLAEEDLDDAVAQGRVVLAEVAKEEPDRTVVRRGVNYLKGVVAAIATGAVVGANQGAAEIGQQIVKDLGNLVI
ncbi:hypothetical protein [Nocardioides luteus]|uniref:hypothetical protein n=1 Tax=Nocardioides luteus TaxID=1844 RepID=UPI0018C9F58C|nr:hypothetical protein [Nocardioides luteus]MBG6096397.1 hypothetical protein [Nocardioides luteus]